MSERSVYAQAAQLASEAAQQGTFGVGGVVVDEAGQVIATARNTVLEGGVLRDPTAHVERELIDKLFELGRGGKLTIISSLEPCMMCAGSILRAGLKCISLSDDPFAGVGVREGFAPLPDELKERAREAFASAAVTGLRASAGPGADRFGAAARTDYDLAEEAFQHSLANIRTTVVGSVAGRTATPPVLPEGSWITDDSIHSMQDFPAVMGHGGGGVSAGLADANGRLLCGAATRDGSPTRTAVSDCVKLFTSFRGELEKRCASELSPPQLTLLISGELDDAAEVVVSLGAAGSFLESPLPSGRAFIQLIGASRRHSERIKAILGRFPPFYVDYVGLRIGNAAAER
jgi:cytosine deaminase